MVFCLYHNTAGRKNPPSSRKKSQGLRRSFPSPQGNQALSHQHGAALGLSQGIAVAAEFQQQAPGGQVLVVKAVLVKEDGSH